ncbi:MAG: hypothetical protein P4N60_13415 [Verrucomicrobiae bacterium]|nr:hypothetical protein [Verrucomicrobiae bacterium]
MPTFAIELIIASLVPAVIAIPVTALLCRMRVVHKRQVGYATVFLGAFVVTFLWFSFVSGGACFSPAFWNSITSRGWTRSGDANLLLLKSVALSAVTSVLSALGVVHYYQKRSKRHEPPAA